MHAPSTDFRLSQISLDTLINHRFLLIGGQAATLLVTVLGLEIALPLPQLIALVVLSGLVNLVMLGFARLKRAGGRMPRWRRVSARGAFFSLLFDLAQLSVLLGLSGGINNPFSLMLLAPVTVGAAILPGRWLVGLMILTVSSAIALLLGPHLNAVALEEAIDLRELGVVAGLIITSMFLVAYLYWVAEEARRMAAARALAERNLSRAQKMSALGALAAAAAHELGSPLNSIAILSSDLLRDLEPDDPLKPDIALIQSESRRCRDILAEIGRAPPQDGSVEYQLLPLSALCDQVAAGYAKPPVQFTISGTARDDTPEPIVSRSPELINGLANILQNALRLAKREVRASLRWSELDVSLRIEDDGPGFPPALLSRLGQPFVKGDDSGGQMGIGLFIAETLLARTGARLTYANGRAGAITEIVWRRSDIEADEPIVPAGE